jgi:pyrroloquinoline quinone (PQQ) biosynthesis protein C
MMEANPDMELGPDSVPLLSPEVTIELDKGAVVASTDDQEYVFEGDGVRGLVTVKHRLDGSASVETLARDGELSTDLLITMLSALAEDGLVLDARPVLDARSTEGFLDGFRRMCDLWAKEWQRSQFWRVMRSGDAPRAVVLGWGIEFHHYVESANDHMAAAVAYSRTDQTIRRWLAEHYVEEHDHSRHFVDGLVACGLSAGEVRAAPPLASTAALINYLTEIATTDFIAYAGTFAAMRGRLPPQHGQLERFYDGLTRLYPFAEPLLEKIRAHSKEDVELDHHELVIERILRERVTVNPEMASRIVRAARGLSAHFVLYFDGIFDFYSRPDAPLPRRPIDARAFLI